METIDGYTDVLDALNLPVSTFAPESVYAYGPVFQGRINSRRVILKRTRSPISRAHALHRWTVSLEHADIAVVAPITGLAPNPVAVGEDVWVVHPFVEGSTYNARPVELYAAGALLGKIHAFSEPSDPDQVRFEWPVEDPVSVEEDLVSLTQLVTNARLQDADQLLESYGAKLRTFHSDYVTPLQQSELVWTMGPWDYKANNLVYVWGKGAGIG